MLIKSDFSCWALIIKCQKIVLIINPFSTLYSVARIALKNVFFYFKLRGLVFLTISKLNSRRIPSYLQCQTIPISYPSCFISIILDCKYLSIIRLILWSKYKWRMVLSVINLDSFCSIICGDAASENDILLLRTHNLLVLCEQVFLSNLRTIKKLEN